MFSQRLDYTCLNDDLENKLTFIKYEFYENYNCHVEFKYHRIMYDVNNPVYYYLIVPQDKKESVNYYCYYSIEIKKNNRVPHFMYREMYDMIEFLLKCSNVNIVRTYDQYRDSECKVQIPISYLHKQIPTDEEMEIYKQQQQKYALSEMVFNKELDLSKIITDYVW
jgi:hypothetical protein